jgi:hypothetical protein
MLGRLFLDNDIFCQSFESFSVWLDHGNCHMASLAGVDVSYGPVLAFMRATDDFASGTVF